jgi:hypothetical protein
MDDAPLPRAGPADLAGLLDLDLLEGEADHLPLKGNSIAARNAGLSEIRIVNSYLKETDK